MRFAVAPAARGRTPAGFSVPPNRGASIRRSAPARQPPSPAELLRRASLLGHRVPVVSRAAVPAIQRMLFYDRHGHAYDPEVLPTGSLRDRLLDWQHELRAPFPKRLSGLPDFYIQQKIGQLELQIEVTERNGGRPVKAVIDDDFASKHLILGDNLDADGLRESIDRSILWRRSLNTVLHLSPNEYYALPFLALAALRQAHYPHDQLVEFSVKIGRATEYREPEEGNEGIFGNFGVYHGVNVRLGARWNAMSQRGVLVHLENITPWAPDISYNYSEHPDMGGHRALTLVYGGGPNTIVL